MSPRSIPLSPRSVPSFAPFKTCCYRVDAALPRDSDAMRLIILHYLLFKNAGSTIEETLDHSFRTRFQLVETANASGIVTDRDLLLHMWDGPGALAVSRHQIRYPTPQAFGYLFFDICFRLSASATFTITSGSGRIPRIRSAGSPTSAQCDSLRR